MKKLKHVLQALLFSLALAMAIPSAMSMLGYNTAVQAATTAISKTSATLIKGQTLKLKISGTSSTVKWKSSKSAVAKVNSNGKVTALKKGTATITATVDGVKYKCKITVVTPSISSKTISLTVGNSTTLKISGTTETVTWKSTDKSVATVSSKGKVKAKGAGTATIKATVLGKTYKCTVTVVGGFSETDALKSQSYRVVDSERFVYYYVTNNYAYSVYLSGVMLFYDSNGDVIGRDYEDVYQLDHGSTFILAFYKPDDLNGDVANYSKYSVEWSVEDITNSGTYATGHSKLVYKVNRGSDSIIIAVTNNSNESINYDICALFHNSTYNTSWYECQGLQTVKPGKTQYLEFSLEWIDGVGEIFPDSWEIYIG